ncbi:MAG: S8 family serine peptidase [Desulfomicrobium escambiense]|nr:S8 family serine peptidase [Desulfomicrobium escambiense]
MINLAQARTPPRRPSSKPTIWARAAGVVIVAAAGNQGNNTPFYPAAYPGVIGVSAVDIDKQLAPYSNFGPVVGVAAPVGNTGRDVNGDGKPDGILSTVANDSGGTLTYDYVIWQGTSLATPHVAGVVALMKAVAPNQVLSIPFVVARLTLAIRN